MFQNEKSLPDGSHHNRLLLPGASYPLPAFCRKKNRDLHPGKYVQMQAWSESLDPSEVLSYLLPPLLLFLSVIFQTDLLRLYQGMLSFCQAFQAWQAHYTAPLPGMPQNSYFPVHSVHSLQNLSTAHPWPLHHISFPSSLPFIQYFSHSSIFLHTTYIHLLINIPDYHSPESP